LCPWGDHWPLRINLSQAIPSARVFSTTGRPYLEQQHAVFSGLKGRFSKPSPQGWVNGADKKSPRP
jgi:hypothetical protein